MISADMLFIQLQQAAAHAHIAQSQTKQKHQDTDTCGCDADAGAGRVLHVRHGSRLWMIAVGYSTLQRMNR